ncbi:hypothetical protein LSUE1_G008761, partial [Lachnellula suecica]
RGLRSLLKYPILNFADFNNRKRATPEPDPDRNTTLQDDLVFVVQCTEAGFRGDYLVFGAPPGRRVSYFNFQDANSTAVSDVYNDNLTSLAANTGGVCYLFN